MSQIIAIAALGKNTRYICHEDQLLWTIPDDLKRLKEETLNHPLIMGRKTYDSIGRALPKRTNIVLTRNKDFKAEDCVVVHTKEAALEAARKAPGNDKIFIFGGAEIYSLFLPETDYLNLTLVDSDLEGTAQFPEFLDEFEEVNREPERSFEDYTYQWVDFKRKAD